MTILNLIGMGNDEQSKRSYFILEKVNEFRVIFNKILDKLKLGYPIPIEQSPIIELENDLDHYKNDNFDLDVIYTRDRIILIVRGNQVNLEKFKAVILAHSKMVE